MDEPKKPKPNKAYTIIKDATSILAGRGGKIDESQTDREGLHLPGGTVEPNETAWEAALREFKEETLIGGEDIPFNSKTPPESSFDLILDNYAIRFFVIAVESVGELKSKRWVDKTKPASFKVLESVKRTKCWENQDFDIKGKTDWFGRGLAEANRRDLL
ncbi:NUDIX domain-containing protein [Rhodanobacter denitrificans]|uniref:NUDIX domain-containing protein n=1 Tax=Rhodanobacter denitrificans TaxID=666685 RepID=A0A368KHP2_9GAMM|nr:NUDIX hydrolase [Rhodanobacter denitrificans]RCS31434.1 NUDIX domain-containing protein [Rhodanobacter denitrificans]